MWDLKNNYKKEEEQTLCPLQETEDDTTEHQKYKVEHQK